MVQPAWLVAALHSSPPAQALWACTPGVQLGSRVVAVG